MFKSINSFKEKNPLFKHVWGNEISLDFSVITVDPSLKRHFMRIISVAFVNYSDLKG